MFRKLIVILLIVSFAFSVSAQADEARVTPQDLADENGQFVEIEGASIYYVAEGDENNPAVILIHGFGGSTFTWRDNIGVIADAGYYVVALDLPPFGLSDKSPDVSHTMRSYADMVVGLMDALAIETATIVGHSMGGSTTAYFTVTYPERVDKLIFVAGGLFGEGMNEQSTGAPLGALANLDPSSEQAIFILETALIPTTFGAIIETAYYFPSIMTDEIVEGYARPILLEGWAEGFLSYSATVEDNPISLDDLAEVAEMPTLILWGEEDSWVSVAMSYVLHGALPNADLVIYPEVGHLPMEEMVEQFNQDVIAFLGGG